MGTHADILSEIDATADNVTSFTQVEVVSVDGRRRIKIFFTGAGNGSVCVCVSEIIAHTGALGRHSVGFVFQHRFTCG